MMRPIRHLLLLILLLMCSCITSDKLQGYMAKERNQLEAEAIVAEWLEQNREWYAQKAAKDFPAPVIDTPKKERVFVPYFVKVDPVPSTPDTIRVIVKEPFTPLATSPNVSFFEKSIKEKELVIQENLAKLKAARAALNNERRAHQGTKQQLKRTKAQRDYYMDLNEKKFWTLIAMAVFAALYIIFKILAARIKVSE